MRRAFYPREDFSSPQTEIAQAALPIVHLILLLCKRIQCKTSGQPPGPPTVLIAPHRTAAAVFVSPVHGTHQRVHQAPVSTMRYAPASRIVHESWQLRHTVNSCAVAVPSLHLFLGPRSCAIGVVISEPNDANDFSAMLIGQ